MIVDEINKMFNRLGSPYRAEAIIGQDGPSDEIVSVFGPDGFDQVYDAEQLATALVPHNSKEAVHALLTRGRLAL